MNWNRCSVEISATWRPGLEGRPLWRPLLLLAGISTGQSPVPPLRDASGERLTLCSSLLCSSSEDVEAGVPPANRGLIARESAHENCEDVEADVPLFVGI